MKAFTVGAAATTAVCVLVLGAAAGCGSQSKAPPAAHQTESGSTPSGSASPSPAPKPTTPQAPQFSAAQVQAGLLRPAQMGDGFDVADYTPSATPSVKWVCADAGDAPDDGMVAVPPGGTGFQEGLFYQQSKDQNDWQPFTVSQIAVAYPDAGTAAAAADKIAAGTVSCTTGTKFVPSKYQSGKGTTYTWKMAKADTAGWRIWRDTQDRDTSAAAIGPKGRTITDLAVKDNVVLVVSVDGAGNQGYPGFDDQAGALLSKLYASMNAAQTQPATAPTVYDPVGPVPITSPPATAPGFPKLASSKDLCARVPGPKIASIMKLSTAAPQPDDRGSNSFLMCHYANMAVSVHVNYGQFANLREVDRFAKALGTKRTFPDLGQGAYWDDNPHGSSLVVRVGNDGLQVFVGGFATGSGSASGPDAPAQAAAIAKLELGG
ncbi:MAG: hypothetical protein HOV87_14350 [Catenulispora sp.]|nr:hypothetical protein [Catenulispora sp.]